MTKGFALCLLIATGITGLSASIQKAQADEPLAIRFDGPAPGSEQPQTSPDSPEAGKLRVSGSYTFSQNVTRKGVVVRYRVKGEKTWTVLDAKMDDEGNWMATKIKLPKGVHEVQARITVTIPGDKGEKEVFADRDGIREVTIK